MRGLLHDWSESSDTPSSYHMPFEPVFIHHLVSRLIIIDLLVAWVPLQRFDVADMGDFIRSPQFAGTLRADAKTQHEMPTASGQAEWSHSLFKIFWFSQLE